MSKNKMGVRDVFIAPVTVNTIGEYTTGSPQRIPQALSVKRKESKESVEVYGDDILQENKTFFSKEEIEYEFNYLTSGIRSLIYGKKFVKGGVASNSDDNSGVFAVGHRTKTLSGKFALVWNYICNVDGGEDEDVDTQTNKPKPSTIKVKFISSPRQKDGNYKYEINENDVIVGDTDAIALLEMDPILKAPIFLKTVAEPIV
ncbi:hypothetical protein H7E67_03915 [Clostridium gasigenes]|uniref:major tail protein n=1 Tax=Clostridium gasigenes TaxID=94869 RepID=UPI00162AA658|nr:major tail protein [Clostridium gasigenes]MBB6622569.1 hypothetical protein [Clostridium gasigenes]